MYSARGGPAGLANKVTQHLGRIGRGGEPPFLGLGGSRGRLGSARRTAPSVGPVQHHGQRPVQHHGQRPGLAPLSTADGGGSARPASPLCPHHRHCSGARGRRSRASRTAPSLQRDPAPDIRLASGAEAGGVGLPSGWWGWVGGGRPSASRGFNLCR